MKSIAIYARVSSEQQAKQATVESQMAALKQRVAAEGHVLLPHDVYVDDGFSGSTLLRPALERLRDRVAEGSVDRLYVHGPDRLARKYAYQVLLLDELRKHGVTVVFLRTLLRLPLGRLTLARFDLGQARGDRSTCVGHAVSPRRGAWGRARTARRPWWAAQKRPQRSARDAQQTGELDLGCAQEPPGGPEPRAITQPSGGIGQPDCPWPACTRRISPK
jgi:hypothetical protein